MADTTAPTSTRPSPRRRTTAKSSTAESTAPTTTAKPARTKAAATVDQVVDESGRENYVFELTHQGDTKSYAKFAPPEGSGCVGTLYMPLGTREVRVRMIGGPAA